MDTLHFCAIGSCTEYGGYFFNMGRAGEAVTACAMVRTVTDFVLGAVYSHPPKVSDKARRRRQYAVVRRGDATQYEAFGG